jgi:hypothetical protein
MPGSFVGGLHQINLFPAGFSDFSFGAAVFHKL